MTNQRKPARLHLVDGTFELFRAHFSHRPTRLAPDGQDVKATFALIEQMLTLVSEREEAVTHVAVAFDNPIRSFRNDLFAEYKSDEGVLPVLRTQFDLAERAVAALGLTVWSMDRFEADDALATAASLFASEVEQVRILSPDKDLMQCVRGSTVVTVDRIRKKTTDEAGVVSKWGVPPRAIPDLLALVGDTADGIPGLPGFGAKTAAQLLSAFGSIDAIPLEAAKWPKALRGADRLLPVLRERVEDARLYRRLATLAEDVPLRAALHDIELKSVGGDAFDAFCNELGIANFKSEVVRSANGRIEERRAVK